MPGTDRALHAGRLWLEVDDAWQRCHSLVSRICRMSVLTCGLLVQAAAWAALNGVGLALVMPCVQAILAEVYYARQRGRAFGLLFTISALGGMFFNFIAVTFGDREINGLPVSGPPCCQPA